MSSFLYFWTDLQDNKLYVGYHKGSENDGYVCSSKLMLQEYKLRPNDFTRQIIAHGELDDIKQLECAILRSVDAKNNADFYNMHNDCGAFVMKKHTNETRQKMSLAAMGNTRSKGHKHTDEFKAHLSSVMKGREGMKWFKDPINMTNHKFYAGNQPAHYIPGRYMPSGNSAYRYGKS